MAATEPCFRPFFSRLVAALSVVAPLLLASVPGRAIAQSVDCDPEYPCTYSIADPGIQKAPKYLKFQARISQTKLPVGDTVLPDVEVRLIDAVGTTKCSEGFGAVRVRNSVLNLEIGHNMADCSLDDVVATADGLSFQVCLGGGCLKPIPLGTAPYAFKADYAVQAQEAYAADRAAQAHYAHRITADRDMMVSNSIGKGYFDFHTPASGGTAYDATAFAPYKDGAFVQWFPVQESNPTMNICAGDLATGEIAPLSELVLYAADTTVRGNAEVEANGVVQGALTVNGGGVVNAGLVVNAGATVNHGLMVADNAVAGADLVCAGDTQVLGHSYLDGGATVNTGATVNDGLLVTNTVLDGPALLCEGDTQVLGHSSLDGGATINEGLVVSDTVVDGPDFLNAGDTTVVGYSQLQGGAMIESGATVSGGATVNEGLVVTDTVSDGPDLYCAGDTSVAGHSYLDGGATVTGGATVEQGLTVTNSLDSAADLTCEGDMRVTGLSYLDGGATVTAPLTIEDQAAAVDLMCQGSAQFDSNTQFGNSPDDSVLTVYSTVNFKGAVSLDNPLTGTVGPNSVDSAAIIDGTIEAADLGSDALNSVRALVVGILSTDLTAVDTGTTMNLNDVASSADGSLWVAVGDYGTILTSVDAVNWDSQSSNTGSILTAVAHGSTGWVAVGMDGTIVSSSDGVEWTNQTSGTAYSLYGIAHDGSGLWVAVGLSGTIVTSSDGVSWTSKVAPAIHLYDVAYDGVGQWLAVGANQGACTSPDGDVWTYRVRKMYTANTVSHDGTGLWVVGTYGGIETSPDGILWTVRSSGDNVSSIACDSSGACLAGVEQAVDAPGALLRTHNRTSWTKRPTGSMSVLSGMSVGNRFVLVGDTGTILISRAF